MYKIFVKIDAFQISVLKMANNRKCQKHVLGTSSNSVNQIEICIFEVNLLTKVGITVLWVYMLDRQLLIIFN